MLQVILPRTMKYRCSETFDENNIKSEFPFEQDTWKQNLADGIMAQGSF